MFLRRVFLREEWTRHNPGVGGVSRRGFASGGKKEESKTRFQTVDGCTAVTHVAYAMSDTAFIFPITPSSPIAELAEQWSSLGVKNAFGDVVRVTQLQSEAGAAGALHGALVTGSMATTFTASQGALLMVPNFYKISGELLPCTVHIAARALASQALSIFGDHQDIMALRSTGWAMLGSTTVQECHDLALVSHLASLRSRVPFHHFFDGFRLSHTIEKVELMGYGEMRKLVDYEALYKHQSRALNPMHPHVRGSNQNPDVYFQMLETSNKFYDAVPTIVTQEMHKVGKATGRNYQIFDYFGSPDAEVGIVVLGSGASVVRETLEYLAAVHGDKTVGVIVPRLFRPWSAEHFLAALPASMKKLAVLDRTKEPGSLGEPLFLDVAATIQGSGRTEVEVLGGRFGLGQKEFTPGSVLSVIENLKKTKTDKSRLRRFTVGIEDDVTFLSLPMKAEPDDVLGRANDADGNAVTQCLIYGFGSDGTVGANKNGVKIIGDNTDRFVQAYFAYGSQKAGGLTLSHLRVSKEPLKSYYSVSSADYIGCHNPVYVDMYRLLDQAANKAVFCLNSPWTSVEELEKNLPASLKRAMAEKEIRFFNIDAFKIAEKHGMGRMINVVMQTAFFRLSDVIEYHKAIDLFKQAIKKSYSHRGEGIVEKNYRMVDDTLAAIHQIDYPKTQWAALPDAPLKAELKFASGGEGAGAGAGGHSSFVSEVQGKINVLQGDSIKLSTLLEAGTLGGVMQEMGTAAYEKRGIALEVPEVDMDKCTQCNYCSLSCPHAVIRPFLLSQAEMDARPNQELSVLGAFDARKAKGGSELAGLYFRIQVSPYDCTGCSVCVNTCPDDALRMVPLTDVHETSGSNWEYAVALPDRGERFSGASDSGAAGVSLKGSQFQQPLFEFSGACAGCGETPYVKLVTQLFGHRMIIANATGCSSIYGAPFGSNPYTVRSSDGRGPAWGNSLFEDAAEYGLGMAVTTALRRRALRTRVQELLMEGVDAPVSGELYALLNEWNDHFADWKVCDRLVGKDGLVDKVKAEAAAAAAGAAGAAGGGGGGGLTEIAMLSDLFPKLSVWTIGGDGWAYDIGFGGLDHALASGQDVNVLVLDTEVYSNTGGQTSKATPLGAIAKFSTGGRENNKKSLAEMAMSYGNVYVANVSMGANMQQTLKALVEAEAYSGPSLVIAYSPCIEHKNIDGMSHTMQHMAVAANSGYFPLFRFNPLLKKDGKNPFVLDTKKLTVDVMKVIEGEMRYGALKRRDVEKFNKSVDGLRLWINERFAHLKAMAADTPEATAAATATADQTAAGADSSGKSLLILYGSETGNTQELAFRTAELARSQRGYGRVQVRELDEVSDLQTDIPFSNVLVMCATCGEGDFPKNAQAFVELLRKERLNVQAQATEAAAGAAAASAAGAAGAGGKSQAVLGHVESYAVFGMGDSSYHEFCSAGKELDVLFAELGAQRGLAMGVGNDRDEDKFETGYNTWLPEFWKQQQAEEVQTSGTLLRSQFETDLELDGEETARLAPYKRIRNGATVEVVVEFNKRLTASDYDRDIRHLRLRVPKTTEGGVSGGLPYLLGDVLNIAPVHDGERVDGFVREYLEMDGRKQYVKLAVKEGENVDGRKRAATLRPRQVSQIFEEVLDTFGRPNRNFYQSLGKFWVAGSEEDKKELELLGGSLAESEQGKKLYAERASEGATFADVLLRYKESTRVPLEHLVTLIPCIKPRLYSIASSPRFVGPDVVELAIVILNWKTPSGAVKTGTGTDYVRRLQPDDKVACTVTSGTFNFPKTLQTPMVMAGLGTGLAPFRAFVQERKWQMDNLPKDATQGATQVGNMWLFYGCRYKSKDYIFGEELEQWKREGVLNELHPAFSRDQKGGKKVYVQNRIDENQTKLHQDLINNKGYFYLCGQAGQAELDIKDAIYRSIAAGEHCSKDQAKQIFQELANEGRYCPELY